LDTRAIYYALILMGPLLEGHKTSMLQREVTWVYCGVQMSMFENYRHNKVDLKKQFDCDSHE